MTTLDLEKEFKEIENLRNSFMNNHEQRMKEVTEEINAILNFELEPIEDNNQHQSKSIKDLESMQNEIMLELDNLLSSL